MSKRKAVPGEPIYRATKRDPLFGISLRFGNVFVRTSFTKSPLFSACLCDERLEFTHLYARTFRQCKKFCKAWVAGTLDPKLIRRNLARRP